MIDSLLLEVALLEVLLPWLLQKSTTFQSHLFSRENHLPTATRTGHRVALFIEILIQTVVIQPKVLSRDIHTAGAGLCQHDAVSKVAMEGPSIVEQLLLDDSGSFANVPFDRNQVTNELSLCLGRIMNVIL
jgi:hypothetical protein